MQAKRLTWFLWVIGFLFFAHATWAQNFIAISGTDTTKISTPLSTKDLGNLSASDDKRVGSNGNWPAEGHYADDKYLEFRFSFPVTTVNRLTLTHEYRRYGAMEGAKLMISGGGVEKSYPVTTQGASSNDVSDQINLSTDFKSIALSDLRVRFMAYRNPGATATAQTTTSHDYVALAVEGGGDAGITTTATPSPDSTGSPRADATPSPSPVQVSSPLVSVEPLPIPSSITPSASYTPSPSPASSSPNNIAISSAPSVTFTSTPIISTKAAEPKVTLVAEVGDYNGQLLGFFSGVTASAGEPSDFFNTTRQLGLVLLLGALILFWWFVIRNRG